ncbi:MAG: DUF445 family protein [Lentisphaeria bacterium]|nr:DUF445 family protein [Lentisphaeria bacterium]
MEQIAEKKKTNWVKAADCACKTASCIILAFMVVLLIVTKTPAREYLPAWLAAGSFFRKYLIPVLSSAAVGYLTNAIAIWMLFCPYEKKWYWPQGVIPRQKKRFGHELGILIPQHLLQPEKISAQIGKVALQYLKDPLFIEKIRTNVKSFLARHSGKLAAALMPYIQKLTAQVLRDNLTHEKFDRFCQMITHNFLNDPETRAKTVQGAVALFKDLLPGFSDDLKKLVAERVADSFRKEHPILSWLQDNLGGNSVESEVENFWRKGQEELLESLEKPETQEKIAAYFSKALLAAKAWTERPENSAQIDQFLLERRQAAEKYVSGYLEERIPAFADELLAGDSFWIMLQEKALPALQLYVVRQLRGDGDSLLAKIDLPGKIENAVDKMNMKELHHFVVKASNDNLTLLQVFGFVLGAAAGVIMALVL